MAFEKEMNNIKENLNTRINTAIFLDNKENNVVYENNDYLYLKIEEEGIYDLNEIFKVKDNQIFVFSATMFNPCLQLLKNNSIFNCGYIRGEYLEKNSKLKLRNLNGRIVPLLIKGTIIDIDQKNNFQEVTHQPVRELSFIENKYTYCNDNYLVVNSKSSQTLILINESTYFLSLNGYKVNHHPLIDTFAKNNSYNIISLRYHIDYFDHALGFTGHKPTTFSLYEDAEYIRSLISKHLPTTKQISTLGYCIGGTTAVALGLELEAENIHIFDGWAYNRYDDIVTRWLFPKYMHKDINFSLKKHLKNEDSKINHYYNLEYADELDFTNCDLTNNLRIKFINDNRSKMVTSIDHVARNKSSIKLFN